MRTKQAFYNLISSILLQLITAVAGFILPPLRIRTYGSSINGLLASIGQFIAYLQIVEAGLSNASVQALYKPLAKKNYFQTASILSASRRFLIQSGAIFAALVALLSVIYPIITKEEVSKLLSFALVITISIGGLLEFFIGTKYRILLTADQKGYVINFTVTAATLLNTVVAILMMYNKTSIILLQILSSLIYFFRIVIIGFYVRRHYKNINFKSEPDINSINKRWDAFIHQITGIVIFNTPVVILTFFCGLKSVSIYMVYSILFGSIGSLVYSFSISLTPGFGELIALGNSERLRKTYNNFECLYYILITIVFTTTMVMTIPFVKLYTHGIKDANYVDPILAVLFLTISVLNQIRIPQNMIISASGHFRETRWRAVCEAVIHIVGSLLLVQYMGIYGVLVGGVLAYCYRTFDIIFYGNSYLLNQSPWSSIRRIVINLIPAVICVLIFNFVYPIHTVNWGNWILTAVGVIIVNFIFVLTANFIFDRIAMINVFNIISNLAKTIFNRSAKVKDVY